MYKLGHQQANINVCSVFASTTFLSGSKEACSHVGQLDEPQSPVSHPELAPLWLMTSSSASPLGAVVRFSWPSGVNRMQSSMRTPPTV